MANEHTLQSIAFPVLDDEQIAQLAGCTAGDAETVSGWETLVATGDRAFHFFVVKSGAVEILDYSGTEPKTVTVHHKGQFTGGRFASDGGAGGILGRGAWG